MPWDDMQAPPASARSSQRQIGQVTPPHPPETLADRAARLLVRTLYGVLTTSNGSRPICVSMMTASDAIVRAEESKIKRFMALGLSRYQAIKAVDDAIDWHEVEALLKAGCALTVALETSR